MDNGRLHLLLRELALLALAALFGAADLVLELLQLHLPALAQLGHRGVALFACREREARAEVAFDLVRLRGRLERVAPHHIGARRLIEMRLQRLRPGGVTRGAQCLTRQLGVFRVCRPACVSRRALSHGMLDGVFPRGVAAAVIEGREPSGGLPVIQCRAWHRRNAASRSRRPWACRAPLVAPFVGLRKYSRNSRRPRRGATAARWRPTDRCAALECQLSAALAALVRTPCAAPSHARFPAR